MFGDVFGHNGWSRRTLDDVPFHSDANFDLVCGDHQSLVLG